MQSSNSLWSAYIHYSTTWDEEGSFKASSSSSPEQEPLEPKPHPSEIAEGLTSRQGAAVSITFMTCGAFPETFTQNLPAGPRARPFSSPSVSCWQGNSRGDLSRTQHLRMLDQYYVCVQTWLWRRGSSLHLVLLFQKSQSVPQNKTSSLDRVQPCRCHGCRQHSHTQRLEGRFPPWLTKRSHKSFQHKLGQYHFPVCIDFVPERLVH